ncbi:cytochrome P460 family protein [Cypionkella sinensis]|uniref:Cytochrome P460 family protein n=1 Tax=Cypionkella sinensis TaxID=1756043 RepID=A0ABV7J3S7_9RHOB
MTQKATRGAVMGGLAIVAAMIGWQAFAEANRVTFPENIDELEQYTTVTRDEVEDILTSREAIEAAKKGQPMPYGTHVVIRFHRDGAITRYFVMQKGEGWGADYPNGRTDDWQFQWFNADRTVNLDENTARCQACHSGRADDQFVFTYDALQAHE